MNVTDLPPRIHHRIRISESGCWEWTGRLTEKGYGHVYFQGTTQRVHRLTYQLLVGPIPAPLELHHRCENEPCCNPAHLELCTTLYNVNQKAGVNKSRCSRGHELTDENTRVQTDRRGHIHRSCKTCARELKRLARAS